LARFKSLLTCIAEEATNAVLNRIKIRSIKGNVVSMDVVAVGHSDDRAIWWQMSPWVAWLRGTEAADAIRWSASSEWRNFVIGNLEEMHARH
jgi:hypothetical protein